MSMLDVAAEPHQVRSTAVEAAPILPVPPSRCQAVYGTTGCYGPPQINAAYGIDRLHRAQITGTGRTVVIPIPFHNPRLRADVDTYSRHWGLPKANIEVVQYGNVPTADPAKPEEAVCAAEAVVDVQAVHAIAPHAKIIVVETPANQTGGTAGLRELIAAIGWVS